ncbi:MAG TPA: carbohydrate kinase family protein [Candidatus Elarobacter sp.]|nr:carbohydrate kinase family protein [Candidatus Elarobacter sp.]
MTRRRRVGVIGTFVWDEIHGRDPTQAPVQEWGGITYALAALDAALSDEWEIVPLIKVGADLATRARDFLATLRHVAPDAAPIEVPYPNNRVVLRYQSSERRTEQLTGGIPGWHWLGLKPLLAGLDALYVNLISGFELTLEVAQLMRQHFSGPVYCDLHSLLLAVNPEGFRVPHPVPNIAGWMQCVDLLQLNEDELALLAPDPMAFAAMAMAQGVSAIHVTMGPRGAVYFAAPSFERLSDIQRTALPAAGALGGAIRTALVPALPTRGTSAGDPTGCGDVWGATYFARLLAGDKLGDAIGSAMRAGARNVDHRGATGLANYLRGELALT